MATSVLLVVSLLLAALCVADGQRTTSEDSQCSYMFKVPAAECARTPVDEQFMKSSIIALQAQFQLLTSSLTDENEKLRLKIATIEAGAVGVRNRIAVNVKQCSRRELGDGKEYGKVFSCAFVKKRNDTVLRVVWNGDIRLIDTGPKGGSCRRWYFTINGQECREPRTIDTQLHIQVSASNIHRPAYVEGYCRGIAAGDVDVAWNVGDCAFVEGMDQSQYNIGNSATGWVATVRIIVEEVDVENADTVIV